jgi:hypothetical protein
MLTTRSDWQILGHFSQLLEEIEHFCGCGQKEVAKIVHCGEKIEEEAIRKGGLKFFFVNLRRSDEGTLHMPMGNVNLSLFTSRISQSQIRRLKRKPG